MMVHFDHSNLCNDWLFEHQRPIQHAGLIILTCATMMVDKEHHNLCNDVCCSSTMNLCNDTCWSTTTHVTMVRFDHSNLCNDEGLNIKTRVTSWFDYPNLCNNDGFRAQKSLHHGAVKIPSFPLC